MPCSLRDPRSGYVAAGDHPEPVPAARKTVVVILAREWKEPHAVEVLCHEWAHTRWPESSRSTSHDL